MFTKYAHFHKAVKNGILFYITHTALSAFQNFKQRIINPIVCRKTNSLDYAAYFISSLALTSRNLLSQVTVVDVEENLSHVITLAQLALQRGDVERAEAILGIGMKLCEDHRITSAMPYIYDILITIAFALGEHEKAEKLLVSGIEKLTQSGLAEDDHYIIDFKLRLARTYSSERKNDMAEIGFKTCLDAQRLKILQGDVSTRSGLLYVNILFWYSIHLARNQQYQDAQKLLNIAYDYSNKIKGLTPYQELVILYTLSDLNAELGDYDSALQNVKAAILLGQGMSTTDLPKLYVKLAKIYVKLGAHQQAKDVAEEAAKLAKIFNNIDAQEEADAVMEEIKKIK